MNVVRPAAHPLPALTETQIDDIAVAAWEFADAHYEWAGKAARRVSAAESAFERVHVTLNALVAAIDTARAS